MFVKVDILVSSLILIIFLFSGCVRNNYMIRTVLTFKHKNGIVITKEWIRTSNKKPDDWQDLKIR